MKIRHKCDEYELNRLLHDSGILAHENALIYLDHGDGWRATRQFAPQARVGQGLRNADRLFFMREQSSVVQYIGIAPMVLILIRSTGWEDSPSSLDSGVIGRTHTLKLAPLNMDLYLWLIGVGVNVTRIIHSEE